MKPLESTYQCFSVPIYAVRALALERSLVGTRWLIWPSRTVTVTDRRDRNTRGSASITASISVVSLGSMGNGLRYHIFARLIPFFSCFCFVFFIFTYHLIFGGSIFFAIACGTPVVHPKPFYKRKYIYMRWIRSVWCNTFFLHEPMLTKGIYFILVF